MRQAGIQVAALFSPEHGFAGAEDREGLQDTTDPNQDNVVATESPTPGLAYPPNTQINLVVYHYVAPPPTTETPTSPPATGSTGPGGTPTP